MKINMAFYAFKIENLSIGLKKDDSFMINSKDVSCRVFVLQYGMQYLEDMNGEGERTYKGQRVACSYQRSSLVPVQITIWGQCYCQPEYVQTGHRTNTSNLQIN